MANSGHLDVVRQGAVAIQQWREQHPNEALDLRGADLHEAVLSGAELHEVILSGADLRGADLSGANLRKAVLNRAVLYGVSLHEADLHEAVLSMVSLHGVSLHGARVGMTIFADLNLSTVKGLDALVHLGPSTIGIDTLYRSGGNIPEAFLRNVGLPDTFITYARSLVGQAIEFYSCFISYSSGDQDFAERLYADLQSKGVRCWFAPEDLKIGDRFRDEIDRSIRVYDKLLLVLSEQSIRSDWVQTEVETALEKERQQGRDLPADARRPTMLFPVRLDDAVIDTPQAWAGDIRRTRHIGDFRRWKEHDAYRHAFDRLLRDLQAESSAKATA